MKKLFSILTMALIAIAVYADDTEQIFYWYNSKASDTYIVETGMIVQKNGTDNRINYVNAALGETYRTICLNGKKTNIGDEDGSNNATYMLVTPTQPLQEGDVIKITAYRNKNASSGANAYLLFSNDASITIGGNDGLGFVNLNSDGDTPSETAPNELTYTITSTEAGATNFKMTRDKAGTNLLITKLEIVTTSTSGNTEPQEKLDVTLSFVNPTTTVNVVDKVKNTVTSSPSVSGITYSSSATSVATVNSTTGEVTGVASGTAQITASFPGNNTYKSASANYTIEVEASGSGNTGGEGNDPTVVPGIEEYTDKPTVPTTKGGHLTFEEGKRYSRLVIDSRIRDFYANKTQRGFNTYNTVGTAISGGEAKGTQVFDYVPGLVAKAIIEAVDYYKDKNFAKPWFYSVQDYALTTQGSLSSTASTLDNLNAAKMYFGLYELTKPGAVFEGSTFNSYSTNTKAADAMTTATSGLADYNSNYSISSKTLADAAGGWYHKGTDYPNQMWCDGQYMGPALLAQLINYGKSLNAIDENEKAIDDWDIVAKQFKITWKYLWDNEKKLLWHAFSADPTGAKASMWVDPGTYHSKEYWGRAEGWYFLALVDVLEQMQKAGLAGSADYNELRGYLNKVAGGLKDRQDASGCWYQLLQYDNSFSANSYKCGETELTSLTKHYSATNYLESSATAIFTAAYLKGMRLGLYDVDYTAVAKKAYKGFVEKFMVSNGDDGTVQLIGCCKSAGLGTATSGKNYRDGSAAYYLLGYDVWPTKDDPNGKDEYHNINNFYTEGKVLGAFIMAATEYERMFIDVEGKDVQNVIVSPANITLKRGEECWLSAQVLPDVAANKCVTWSIEENDCVTVSADGHVTANDVTTTPYKVYATSVVDGNIKDFCLVTVVDNTNDKITKYISEHGWASFVPEKNVEVPAGTSVKVYYVKEGSYDNKTVKAVQIESGKVLAKNQGYIINGEKGIYEFTVSDSEDTFTFDGNENMLKCGKNEPIEEGCFVFGQVDSKPGFYALASYDINVPEGIVYIKIGGANGAKSIVLDFDDSTGIQQLEADTKETNNKIFTISGQRINNISHHGVYIVDGKKIAVK